MTAHNDRLVDVTDRLAEVLRRFRALEHQPRSAPLAAPESRAVADELAELGREIHSVPPSGPGSDGEPHDPEVF